MRDKAPNSDPNLDPNSVPNSGTTLSSLADGNTQDNILPQDVQNFLKATFIKANLSEATTTLLNQEIIDFYMGKVQDFEKQLTQEAEMLKQKLQNIWQDSTKSKVLLAKRAFNWLNITNEDDLNDLDEIKFLNKMVHLGELLSEDKNLNTLPQQTALTPEIALQQRAKLTRDKTFMEDITRKTSLGHKEAIKKLNMLNAIIAQGM
ncbi:hypothetical protein ABSA28_00968 [Candidatus Hepatincolaceae symbiont of Richtersius coronifer]